MRIQPNRPKSYRKTHVTAFSKGWKYARAVPLDLRRVEGGKTSWVKYLGRVDYATGLRLARALDEKYDARIAALRRLSQAEVDEILSVVSPSKNLSPVDVWLKEVKRDQQFEPWDDAIATLLNEVPLDPDPNLPDSENGHDVLEIVRLRKQAKTKKEILTNRKKIADKIAGEPQYRMLALVKLWVEKKTPRSPKTVEKANLYVHRFVKVCGDLDPHLVRELTRLSFWTF